MGINFDNLGEQIMTETLGDEEDQFNYNFYSRQRGEGDELTASIRQSIGRYEDSGARRRSNKKLRFFARPSKISTK